MSLTAPPGRADRKRLWLVGGLAGLCCIAAGLIWELDTSSVQSHLLSKYAADIDYELRAGANPTPYYPGPGPFDRRAGYSELPSIVPRLEQKGFTIVAQARVSTRFEELVNKGFFPIYSEKVQTGLEILDRDQRTLFAHRYPERVLADFDSIPPLLIRSLLYIENRELFAEGRPYRNPAVEWDRLGWVALQLGRRSIGEAGTVPGASTLATQIEKFRHSLGGMTQTPTEKFRQMASASLRAYRSGRSTLDARRRIVVDYLNGLPLAAMPNYGEVHGLVDGLWLWYGIEVGELELLREPIPAERLPRAAYVYRAALSLILATRRPAFYLSRGAGTEELEELCDFYSTLLAQQRVIPDAVVHAVRETRLVRRHGPPLTYRASFVEQKAPNAIRANLLTLLGVSTLYQLDRLDLKVVTSIDGPVQSDVARELGELQGHERRDAAGFTGTGLLPAQASLPVTFSVLLCEATPEGNFVRVQADSFEGPRDVNRHTKLELGSTAKLRVLVSYLEVVEALHGELVGASSEMLDAYSREFTDPLTEWVVDLIRFEPWISLDDALSAAIARRYSASPAERFFTAGGLHYFSNFDRTFDSTSPTVQEGFSHSVNLVFIRIMRDVVRYHEQRLPSARDLIADPHQSQRADYLARFADREGEQFMNRFYRKHSGRTPIESIDALIGTRKLLPLRAARIYLAVLPEASASDLGAFLAERFPDEVPASSALEALYRRAQPNEFALPDLAYLVDAHPLELWVAGFLARNPGASLSQTIRAGGDARQEAYRWLFRTRHKKLQDDRIRTVLEADAFAVIHAGWRRLGYPFPSLVPSYATAIGSSGDTPEALAELLGILVNDGIRRPFTQVEALRFAETTPFETHLARAVAPGTRILSSSVAQVARVALVDVIASGTGRRVREVFVSSDGTPLRIGGKTGTGDNQHVIVDARGGRIASHARNRTAALVFFVENYFGIVTAHVEGPAAGDLTFTSALPAQLLRHLAPTLEPLLNAPQDAHDMIESPSLRL